MKILAVSDVTSDLYYRYYQPGRLDPFDLILSCGDLNPDYIEFLVTLAHCPLVYVHGNHDDGNRREPEGCICADGRIVEVNGLRIMGLGGSYRYRDGRYMYTEKQMARRARGLAAQLRHKSGFDVLLTHAPAYGLNDLPTLPHRGFECFNTLPHPPVGQKGQHHRRQRLRALCHRLSTRGNVTFHPIRARA